MMFGFRVWWKVWGRDLLSRFNRFIKGTGNMLKSMMWSMAGPMRMDWVVAMMRSMVWCRIRRKVMNILMQRMWPSMVGRGVMSMV